MEGRARRQSADVVQSFDIIQFCCHFGVPRLVCVTANLSSTGARVKEAVLFSHMYRDASFPLRQNDDEDVFSALCSSLPNLANTCYLNSSLQSLLAFRPFVQEVTNQHRVWSSHPGDAPGYLFSQLDMFLWQRCGLTQR